MLVDVMKLGSPWAPQLNSLDFQNPLVCKYVLYTEAPVLKIIEKTGERGAKGGDNGPGPEYNARCVWPRSALALKTEHDEQEVGSPFKYYHCRWPRTGKVPTSSSPSSEFVTVPAAEKGPDSNTNGSARCQDIESRGLNSSPPSVIGSHCAWPKVVQSKDESVLEMARGPACPWPRQTRALKSTQPSGYSERNQSLHELVLNPSPQITLEDTKELPRGLNLESSGICVNGSSSIHHSRGVGQTPDSSVNGDAEKTRTSDSPVNKKPLGARCEWPRGTATGDGHSASLTKPQFSGSGMNGASLRNESSSAFSVDLLSGDGTSSEKVPEKHDHLSVVSSGGVGRPVGARCEWPRGKGHIDVGGKKLEHATKLRADDVNLFPRCEFPRNFPDLSTNSNSLAIPLPRCQWPRTSTPGEKPSDLPTSPEISGITNGSLHSASGYELSSSSSSSSSPVSVREKDNSERVMPLPRCEWPRKTPGTSLDTSGESNGIAPSISSSPCSLIVDNGDASEAASKSLTVASAIPLPRCQWPRITAGEKLSNAVTSCYTSGTSNGSAHLVTGNGECSSSSSVSVDEKDASGHVIPLPRCEWPRKATATTLDTSGLLNESHGNDSSSPSFSSFSTSVSVDEGDACVAVMPGPQCAWPRKKPAPEKSHNQPTTLQYPNDLQENNGSVHSATRTTSPSSSFPSAPLAKEDFSISKALPSQLEGAAVITGPLCPSPRSSVNASDVTAAEQVQNVCASHHHKLSQTLQTHEDEAIRDAHGTTTGGARCPWPRIAVNVADISREADLQNGSALHHQVDAETSTNGGARCPWPRNSVTLKPLSSNGSALSSGESHPQQSKDEKMMEEQEVGTTPGPRCSWPPKHAGSQPSSNAKPSLPDSVVRSEENSESEPFSSLSRRRMAYSVGLSLMKGFLLTQGGSALASPSDLHGFVTGLSKSSPIVKLDFSPGNPSQEGSQDILVSRCCLVDPVRKLLTSV